MSFIYARASDNLAALATIVGTTADPDYPAANLVDLKVGKPAKLTGATGNWVFDFGVAKSIELFSLHLHNLTAGLSVRLQANAADSWGAPSLDLALVIPAYRRNGFPRNPWLDLTTGSHSFRYWRLVVVGSNAAPVAVGEVGFWAAKRTLAVNVSWGAVITDRIPVVEHKTDIGESLRFPLGTAWRELRGECDTSDAGADELADLWDDALGRALAWLAIPDSTVNDAWLSLFARASDLPRQLQFLDRNTVPFEIDEVSPGLRL